MDRPDNTVEINKTHLVDGMYGITDLIDMNELRGLCEVPASLLASLIIPI